jgi:hypothetical protein
MEHMIRACLLALRLADRLGFDDGERGTLYYSGLLAWVGCHTDAYEQAKWFGDDLSLMRDAHYGYDFGKAGPAAAFMVKHVGGAGGPLLLRARLDRFLGERCGRCKLLYNLVLGYGQGKQACKADQPDQCYKRSYRNFYYGEPTLTRLFISCHNVLLLVSLLSAAPHLRDRSLVASISPAAHKAGS